MLKNRQYTNREFEEFDQNLDNKDYLIFSMKCAFATLGFKLIYDSLYA